MLGSFGVLTTPLTTSIFHHHARNGTSPVSPLFTPNPDWLPDNPANVNFTQRRTLAHVVQSRTYTPICLLAPQREESAGGVRHRGLYTAPLGRRFDAGELAVGTIARGLMGMCLGRMVFNWWGAKVVHGSFGGIRAINGLVFSLLPPALPPAWTLTSACNPLTPDLNGSLLVCPHAHPRVPIISPPNTKRCHTPTLFGMLTCKNTHFITLYYIVRG